MQAAEGRVVVKQHNVHTFFAVSQTFFALNQKDNAEEFCKILEGVMRGNDLVFYIVGKYLCL